MGTPRGEVFKQQQERADLAGKQAAKNILKERLAGLATPTVEKPNSVAEKSNEEARNIGIERRRKRIPESEEEKKKKEAQERLKNPIITAITDEKQQVIRENVRESAGTIDEKITEEAQKVDTNTEKNKRKLEQAQAEVADLENQLNAVFQVKDGKPDPNKTGKYIRPSKQDLQNLTKLEAEFQRKNTTNDKLRAAREMHAKYLSRVDELNKLQVQINTAQASVDIPKLVDAQIIDLDKDLRAESLSTQEVQEQIALAMTRIALKEFTAAPDKFKRQDFLDKYLGVKPNDPPFDPIVVKIIEDKIFDLTEDIDAPDAVAALMLMDAYDNGQDPYEAVVMIQDRIDATFDYSIYTKLDVQQLTKDAAYLHLATSESPNIILMEQLTDLDRGERFDMIKAFAKFDPDNYLDVLEYIDLERRPLAYPNNQFKEKMIVGYIDPKTGQTINQDKSLEDLYEEILDQIIDEALKDDGEIGILDAIQDITERTPPMLQAYTDKLRAKYQDRVFILHLNQLSDDLAAGRVTYEQLGIDPSGNALRPGINGAGILAELMTAEDGLADLRGSQADAIAQYLHGAKDAANEVNTPDKAEAKFGLHADYMDEAVQDVLDILSKNPAMSKKRLTAEKEYLDRQVKTNKELNGRLSETFNFIENTWLKLDSVGKKFLSRALLAGGVLLIVGGAGAGIAGIATGNWVMLIGGVGAVGLGGVSLNRAGRTWRSYEQNLDLQMMKSEMNLERARADDEMKLMAFAYHAITREGRDENGNNAPMDDRQAKIFLRELGMDGELADKLRNGNALIDMQLDRMQGSRAKINKLRDQMRNLGRR